MARISTLIAGVVAGATGPTGPTGATGASGATTTISNGTSNLNILASGGAIYANTAGVNAITVDTSQKVGIGTTSPANSLNVYNASAVQALFNGYSGIASRSQVAAGSVALGNNAAYQLQIDYSDASNTTATIKNTYANASSLLQIQSGYLTFGTGTSFTEAMRIDSAGNVGIGTSSPTQKLTLNSGFVQTGNGIGGAGGIWFPTSTGSVDCRTWRVRTDIAGYGDFGIEQSTTQTGTTFATKFLINQTGQVGINVNPAAGNTFRVVNIGSDNAVQFGNVSNGVYLANGGTSFSAYSDTRLKNITGIYETPLADIAKIDVIKFTWKNDTENKPQVGVSAQSVEIVIPEAIDRGTNFNAEGDTTEYLSVRYTELIPLMISSIQELNAKVEALEARLGS